jgi:CDP-diacylglycerol--glycerol-3-phosphate 3-phosphatidyltransferase
VGVFHRLGNDGMNLPNICTLSRVPLMFLIVALLYVDGPGVAAATFLLYVLAGVTDFLDGYLARRFGRVSNFGILMDAVTDKVLLLGILIALVDLDRIPLDLRLVQLPGFVPVFLLLAILGREFLVTGIRLVAASKGVVVAADRGGKIKTVVQILAVGAFLAAGVARADLGRWCGADLRLAADGLAYAGLALLVAATVFTLTSGFRYFRRYASMILPA